MNTYEERKQEKLRRYQELSYKYAKESASRYERSNKLAEMIPFGQPILIGHHSEGTHRRHIVKIQSNMNKSIELLNKSEYYENKVKNIQNNNSISSDDPEAVNKLKEKLEGLLKKREEIKAREHCDWELRNLSGNITTVKKRIEYLEKQKNIPETPEITINNIILKVNKDINRVQIVYPNKPEDVIRTKLKSNGFRWSPSEQAWQRQYSAYAYQIGKEIISINQGDNNE